jgi:hypothetical protein
VVRRRFRALEPSPGFSTPLNYAAALRLQAREKFCARAFDKQRAAEGATTTDARVAAIYKDMPVMHALSRRCEALDKAMQSQSQTTLQRLAAMQESTDERYHAFDAKVDRLSAMTEHLVSKDPSGIEWREVENSVAPQRAQAETGDAASASPCLASPLARQVAATSASATTVDTDGESVDTPSPADSVMDVEVEIEQGVGHERKV